jgi:hypothetical protein
MTDVDGSRGERLQLMLSPDELTLIDDFRFKQRMPSRAAGLTVEGISSVPFGSKSSKFGVAAAQKPNGRPRR